jgi:hypothetical protein
MLAAAMPELVMTRLASADGDEYRRLAELLWHVGDRETLVELTARALVSADSETRAVGEDFSVP